MSWLIFYRFCDVTALFFFIVLLSHDHLIIFNKVFVCYAFGHSVHSHQVNTSPFKTVIIISLSSSQLRFLPFCLFVLLSLFNTTTEKKSYIFHTLRFLSSDLFLNVSISSLFFFCFTSHFFFFSFCVFEPLFSIFLPGFSVLRCDIP